MISRFLAIGASLLGTACSGSGDGTPATAGTSGAAGALTGAAGAPSSPGVGAGGTVGIPTSGGSPGSVVPSGGGGVSSVAGAPAVPGSGSQPAVGGVPGVAGAPGGGGSSGSGQIGAGGVAGGSGGMPAMDPPGTASISAGAFTVQPGQEVFKCQNFDNPFAGKDVALATISSELTKGSHHLHLYNLTEGTSRTIEDCSGSDFHSLLYATGRPTDAMAYPAGMATKIRGNSGLRIQIHFLNTGTAAVDAKATLKFIPVADPSTVTKWVASIYFNRIGLSVPPGQGQTVSTSCSIPSAYGSIGIVRGVSHMHSRGVHFVAKTSTGATLIDDTNWDEPPPHVYDPPVAMNPGESIDWTCTYDNMTGKTLTFGNSAAANEMCIFVGRYYSTDANDVQIVCMAPSAQGGTAQLEAN